jgi:hypothetical protein
MALRQPRRKRLGAAFRLVVAVSTTSPFNRLMSLPSGVACPLIAAYFDCVCIESTNHTTLLQRVSN